MGDLKLTNSGVITEGDYLAIHGAYFELKDSKRYDSKRRRSHHRKALVHENNDTLVVNHANDYKGVVINSREVPFEVNGKSDFSDKITVPDILISKLPKYRMNVNQIPIGRRNNIRGNSLRTEPSSLVEIIKELRKEIKDLNNKVKSLELAR